MFDVPGKVIFFFLAIHLPKNAQRITVDIDDSWHNKSIWICISFCSKFPTKLYPLYPYPPSNWKFSRFYEKTCHGQKILQIYSQKFEKVLKKVIFWLSEITIIKLPTQLQTFLFYILLFNKYPLCGMKFFLLIEKKFQKKFSAPARRSIMLKKIFGAC